MKQAGKRRNYSNHNPKPDKTKMSKVVREQSKKDSPTKRVNFDNTRVSKFEKDLERGTTEKGTRAANDIRWYSRNPQLLQASAGSVVFSSTTGQPLSFDNMKSIPGIMTLKWTQSIGPVDIEAVKQAQESIYSYVVHANSRNQSYDSVDLMLMILGTAEVFSWIGSGIRLYGTMKRFDGENYYMPQALVKAQGFDYKDMQAHLSDLWFYLNQVIAQSAQLWIPKDLPFVERWFWLNSNIYKDSESAKGQMYMFVPDRPHIFNPTYNSKGGGLSVLVDDTVANRYSTTPLTFSKYVEVTDKLINALLTVQDRGIMLGDVLKAYGPENIYALSEIPVDYVTPLVYDREVLTQIENATAMEVGPYEIGQTDNGYLQMGNSFGANPISDTTIHLVAHMALPKKLMLNFHFSGQPTAADIMVATRLMAIGTKMEKVNEVSYKVYPETCGTELVTGFTMYMYNTDGVSLQTTPWYTNTYIVGFHTPGQVISQTHVDEAMLLIKRISLASAFDWAPIAYLASGSYTNTGGKAFPSSPGNVFSPIGDLDNCIEVDVALLRKLNNTALYSEFGVPKM